VGILTSDDVGRWGGRVWLAASSKGGNEWSSLGKRTRRGGEEQSNEMRCRGERRGGGLVS
jgi:hypothetical protein